MSTGPINLLLQSMLRLAGAGHKHTNEELERATKLIYEDAEQVVYPDSPTKLQAEELSRYYMDTLDIGALYTYAVEQLASWYRRHPEVYREEYHTYLSNTRDYDEEEE